MSYEAKTIYLWEPTGARTCGDCTSMPKWSDDPPQRPHDPCDCNIDRYVGFARVEYRNIQEQAGGGAVRVERFDTGVTNNTDKEITHTETFQVAVKQTVTVSVQEVADHLGVSAGEEVTRTVTRNVSVPIPPGKTLVVEAEIESVARLYTAEKVYIFPVYDGNGYTDDTEEMSAGIVEGVSMLDEQGDFNLDVSLE